MDKIFHSLINENEQDNQNIVFDHKRKRSDEDDIEPPVRLGISTSNDNLLEMSAQILSSISSTTKEPTRLNELCNVCGKSLDIHLSPCGVAESVAYDKPYVCKEQGCGKTYKNANGLKYHKIHGHCEGTTIDDDQLCNLSLFDTSNFLAYKLQRPYECSFECPKRYKNLNGVKYHLEKSHGMEKQKAAIHATEIVCLTHVKYGIVGRNVDPEVLQNAIRNAEGKSEKMRYISI